MKQLLIEIKDVKRSILFYKSKYDSLKLKNWLPVFTHSKNVQAWFFTRDFTLYWLRWAITYSITITSDLDIDRAEAHKMNVEKYMKKKQETKPIS